MAVRTREICFSANGDRWLLAHDPNSGRVFVSAAKWPTLSSGAFLIAAGNGPEKHTNSFA
jgi:hypothetical protein